MTFLEHGDIRKSGRAILIACTIFVLLNECSEVFDKVVLFGFEVRITHEMLLGFLRVGIGVLSVIFVVRFAQGYASWHEVFSGEKAAEARQVVLVNEIGQGLKPFDTKMQALEKVKKRAPIETNPGYPRHLENIRLVKSEYRRFYLRRLGDQIDALLLQVVLPLAAVIYAFWVSPTLTLVCAAV